MFLKLKYMLWHIVFEIFTLKRMEFQLRVVQFLNRRLNLDLILLRQKWRNEVSEAVFEQTIDHNQILQRKRVDAHF